MGRTDWKKKYEEAEPILADLEDKLVSQTKENETLLQNNDALRSEVARLRTILAMVITIASGQGV